jgi:hypothetical protein
MSVKMLMLLTVAMLLATTVAFAQPPDTLWTKTVGGDSVDISDFVQQTPDGGFIIAGLTMTYDIGEGDYWLIRMDENGDTLWTRTYGGPEYDEPYHLMIAADAGYLILGQTMSFGAGGNDMWLLKTNADGDSLWSRTYGGPDGDGAWRIAKSSDGGYILVGVTSSYGAGGDDVYLIKTDVNGDTLWTKTFGGTEPDGGTFVCQTDDGGYIITGYTASFGAGDYDLWLLKTDQNGDSLWSRTYGGGTWSAGISVHELSNGDFTVIGATDEYGAGANDAWMIRTDASGDSLWSNTYGGSLDDNVWWGQQTTDQGYVFVGSTESFGGGAMDIWLVKTDANGNEEWSTTFGESGDEWSYSVCQTTDGGYFIGGVKGTYFLTEGDAWLIRLEGEPPLYEITLDPHDPPIIIPLEGGSFIFDVTVINNSISAETFDAWINVELPSSFELTVLGPIELTMDAGDTLTRERTQVVPATAPAGAYNYIGFVGDHAGWEIVNTDAFTFTKEEEDDQWTGFEGWFNSGEPFPGEDPIAVKAAPDEFALLGAHPNPFNLLTTISFSLPDNAHVTLTVYDPLGRLVTTLVSGHRIAGHHQVTFDAGDLPSGIYFYRLEAGDYTAVNKMVLMK